MLWVSVTSGQSIKHKPGSANGTLFMFYLLKSTKIRIYQHNSYILSCALVLLRLWKCLGQKLFNRCHWLTEPTAGSQSGWRLAFGQNGLLHDNNVAGVLAARGLERNSFPSHSFSWHLSPVYAPLPFSAPTLHPFPHYVTHAPESFTQVITANCHG